MRHIVDCSMYYMDKELVNKGIKKIKDDEISISLFEKRKIVNAFETNRLIYDAIKGGNPFLVGRFGANELSMMKTIEFDIKSKYEICTNMMYTNAGFFPNDIKAIEGFLPLMIDFCKECDVLGTWNQPFEGYFIKNYMRQTSAISKLFYLEPWINPDFPWSAALEGKKVLVIHPFIDTIKKQYGKREYLFPGTDILPSFQLKTLKAVQTVAGTQDERFGNWFDALEWMYQEAVHIDFDVAIIGCGAYGAPLAAKIKKYGKQAIHLGGATQILFGIIGNRWTSQRKEFEYVRKLFNEYWVRPSSSEIVVNASQIENGCYW